VAAEAGLVEGEPLADGARAGLEGTELSPLLGAAVARASGPLAHAWQAAGAGAASSMVLTADLSGTAALFTVRDRAPAFVRDVPGVGNLAALLVSVAGRLGWRSDDGVRAIEFLEVLASGTEAHEYRETFAVAATAPDLDAAVISAAAHRGLDGIEAQAGESLRKTDSFKVAVQRARAAAAAAVLERACDVLSELAARWQARARVESLVVTGDLFSSAAFLGRLRARCGASLQPAPVPEPEGTALGAALASQPSPAAAALGHLALGPAYTETEAKAALENARLDYLYEPRWDRLLARVSRLLSKGKLVAWFQGPADFGPRSLGSRSVLGDPSDRYVRDNVNRFLKQRADQATLPVSTLPEAAAECLDSGSPSPWMLARAGVRPDFRDRLRAAVDASGRVTYHTVAGLDTQPGLVDLLRVHRERTGVPALVNTTLAGPDEPVACSPRDAVRTFFSSALDALVIHRFLLMKDYWQMRSEGE
jgi:carbamoyltransferase